MSRANDDENIVKLTMLNREFHLLIARISTCRFLVQFIDLLHDSIHRYPSTTYFNPERRALTMLEHKTLVDAIEKHDATKAEQAAQDHMRNALQTRLALIEGRI
jgi:DNA-binding GntR family transcriptional regulator